MSSAELSFIRAAQGLVGPPSEVRHSAREDIRKLEPAIDALLSELRATTSITKEANHAVKGSLHFATALFDHDISRMKAEVAEANAAVQKQLTHKESPYSFEKFTKLFS